MEDQQVIVESQPTPVVPPVDASVGPLVGITPEQRSEFRKTGNLPKTEDPPAKEESAPSDPPKEAEADAGDPPPPTLTPQERIDRDKAKATKRFNDLIEENKRLKADLEARKPAPKQEPPKQADTEPTPEDQNADGTPKYKSYEEFSKALARWEVKQELAEQRRIETEQAQAKEFAAKMAEAESRYENFTEIADPFAGEILGDAAISPVVKQMFRDSDVMPDLVFTIASNAKDRADFIKMAKQEPGKAIRYIALTESLITDQLEGKKTPVEETPVKPKTQAPKPPTEAGGRAAAPPDALESAAKANDFRSFKSEATRRQLAKLKA